MTECKCNKYDKTPISLNLKTDIAIFFSFKYALLDYLFFNKIYFTIHKVILYIHIQGNNGIYYRVLSCIKIKQLTVTQTLVSLLTLHKINKLETTDYNILQTVRLVSAKDLLFF